MTELTRDAVEETLNHVREALDRSDITAAITALEKLKQEDQVEVFDELDVEDQAELLPRLDPEKAADIVVELDQEDQAEIAGRVNDSALADILDEMEPDDAADVIGDLPEQRQQRVLAEMAEASDVRPLLIHPDESAGGLMTTSFLTLRPGMTSQDAINALREWSPDDEMPYYLFVVDRERKLVGVVSLRQLLVAQPATLISQIMRPEVVTVQVGADQEAVANLMKKYDFLALPVVDPQNRLVGIITVDDVVDVIEEEATEDVYRLGGVPDEERVWSPLGFSLRKRLPWLVINLGTAFLAGWVASLFEATIAKVAILGALQSIVAGQGGVAVTQRITIIVRGLALDEVELGDVWRVLAKETFVSFLQGLVIAILVGVGVGLWQRNWVLGAIMAVSMLANMVVAGVVGATIPFMLKRMHIDPALASSVIATTFTDCCGFLFSLGLATILINYLPV